MFYSKSQFLLFLFHFDTPLEMARCPKTAMAHLPCQCSAYLQFPLLLQPKELAGGAFLCKSFIKSSSIIVPLESHYKILFTILKNLGGKLSLQLLLLKLDSHSEHHAHSGMSFEVKTHSFIIQ